MQGRRNIFDIFPETVDLNQRPNSNSRGINESGERNNRLSPSERIILSNDRSNERNKSQSYSGWDVGESSSRTNVQDQVFGLKLGSNWPSSFGTHDSIFRERQFDHQIPVGPLNTQSSGSNHTPMDVDLNVEYNGNSSNDNGHVFGSMNHYSSSAGVEGSSSRTADERGPIWGPSMPTGAHGSSQRYYGMRDPGSFSIFGNRGSSSTSNNSSSHEPSRRFSQSQYLDQSLNNSSHRSSQQPPSVQVPGMSRNILPFPMTSNSSRNGSSSNEMRNFVQDPVNLNLGNGRSNINGGGSSSSSSRNDNTWLPNLNSSTLDEDRPIDVPPWTLFPNLGSESGGHRGHYRHFTPGSSSNSEERMFSGRNRQPFVRSLEVFDDDDDEWQADIERRNWLASEMRQILNALRRSEGLRVEDHMPFDPFMNGVADMHDRHRDMRLDVDNMSYEELLALEERIGDVKVGLSEEVIMKSMKQRKHMFFLAMSTLNLEPCCICQEEYENGDDIGTLDCGHDFHTGCIKQWLTQKNLCPICKKPGLST